MLGDICPFWIYDNKKFIFHSKQYVFANSGCSFSILHGKYFQGNWDDFIHPVCTVQSKPSQVLKPNCLCVTFCRIWDAFSWKSHLPVLRIVKTSEHTRVPEVNYCFYTDINYLFKGLSSGICLSTACLKTS